MNIGVQDGLLDPKHERAMGTAVWLFLWCIRCETQKSGFVLGGMPLTYAEISRRSKFPERKLRRWMNRLRKYRYIVVTHTNYCYMRIEVMKPKKWFPRQKHLQFSNPRPEVVNLTRPEVVNMPTKNGQLNKSCSLRDKKKEIKAEEGTATAAILRAFDALGYKTPFGVKAFQDDWAEEYPRINGGGFTEAMENTIQRCQAKKINVPNLFFALKRQVEKMEVAQRFKEHPL